MVMKKFMILLCLCIFLAGCGVEFGQNYEHLQNQDVTKRHEVDVTGDTNRNVGEDSQDDVEVDDEPKGLYEELNNNLCDISPECCGQLTDDQKNFRDLEKRAVVEDNKELCYQLPTQPFVISCGNDFEEDETLYSRQRCLDAFS